MPYSFRNLPLAEPEPSPVWVDLVQEAPSEIMIIHDALMHTHTVELNDDLTELWVSGGRMSVVDASKGRVTLYTWPLSGAAPLTISEDLPAETALEYLKHTQA